MKRIILIALSLLAAISLLTACSGGASGGEFKFKSGDIEIKLGGDMADVLSALGDPVDYDESTSCAFDGLDKVYKYNGFEIKTYPDKDKDYVLSITILNDTVETLEGITIGSSEADIKKAYGDDFEAIGDGMIYTKGKTKLQIIVRNGAATSVKYEAIVD